MSKRKTIRVMILGSGWVTEHRHLPALQAQPNTAIVGVISKDAPRAAALQKRFGIPQRIESDIATLKTEDFDSCDAVVIGTDPFCHYLSAKKALSAGKHVLMEKPFTIAKEEAEELIALSEQNKCKLAVVHNFQYASSTKSMLNDVAKGVLGSMRSLEAVQYSNEKRRLPRWYKELPWGLYYDESPHLLYLLQKFGGEIKLKNSEVYFEEGNTTPQLVNASFQTTNGPALLRMNFGASLSEWFLIFHGSKKTGIVDIFRDIYFSVPNDEKHTPFTILRTSFWILWAHVKGSIQSGVKVLTGDYLCGNKEVMKIFLDAIRNNEPLGEIDAKNGLFINDVQREIMNTAVPLSSQ